MAASDNLNSNQFNGPEVWRGLHGENAAAAADAHRRGEGGQDGGLYVTPDIVHASTYAQRYQGDKTGVMMRGRLHNAAKPDDLGFVNTGDVKWEPKNYSIGEAYKIDDQRKGYDYPDEHYQNL